MRRPRWWAKGSARGVLGGSLQRKGGGVEQKAQDRGSAYGRRHTATVVANDVWNSSVEPVRVADTALGADRLLIDLLPGGTRVRVARGHVLARPERPLPRRTGLVWLARPLALRIGRAPAVSPGNRRVRPTHRAGRKAHVEEALEVEPWCGGGVPRSKPLVEPVAQRNDD